MICEAPCSRSRNARNHFGPRYRVVSASARVRRRREPWASSRHHSASFGEALYSRSSASRSVLEMPTLPFSTRLILLAALPRLSAARSWVSPATSRSLRSSLPSWRRWMPVAVAGVVICGSFR